MQSADAGKLKVSREGNSSRVNVTKYRCLVGSLRYLVNTRLDLPYSVGYVSRFMEKPHMDHLAVVKKILRYIAGSRNWGHVLFKGKWRA
jgi:hypothetical protein